MSERTLEEVILEAVAASEIGEIPPEKLRQLETFLREVALQASRMHLVGRSRTGRNIGLLVLDSLLLLGAAEKEGILPSGGSGGGARGDVSSLTVADVGSGAGFPGIAWKILRPDLEVTLFERKERTHAFLERIIALLSLQGVKALAEDATGYSRRASFDVVVSKAAGRLSLLLPLAKKLLVPGGAYITVKGRSWRDECSGSESSGLRFTRSIELSKGRGIALVFRKAE